MKEECAVIGVCSNKDVIDQLYCGLYSMQHRGQESAGIAVCTDPASRGESAGYTGHIDPTGNTGNTSSVSVHKGMGLVSEVFRNLELKGDVGIGHVRYSTTGESGIGNSQPMVINYAKGSFAIAHNGNLVNSIDLRSTLKMKGCVFSTTTDTEIIAKLIVQEHMKTDTFTDAIKSAMNSLEGSYSLVILYENKIIGIRDPRGFRPLVLGRSNESYALASETCALDAIDMAFVRDIKPSEIIIIGDGLKPESHTGRKEKIAHCMFEYVYFARPDSVIDGKAVYEIRKNLGRILSREAPVDADMVIAVPDSGITTAIGYANASKIPYGEGLMKNRYFGRTFILPNQEERERGVRIKLNPIRSEIEGKRLILVDDSIVRGTTIKRIIRILREFGASEINVRISCPPVRFPCFYGINMQTCEEFAAAKKTVEEIREKINADSLAYTSLEGLIKAIGFTEEKMCLACLTGDYPIKDKQMKLEL